MCIPFVAAGATIMGTQLTAGTALMMNAALTASMAGGLMSAYGQLQQGEYQAGIAKNNAIVQQQQAKDALQRGEQAELHQRIRSAQAVGRQRAQMGAAGVGLSSGSPSQVLQDTAKLGELDALTVRNNAQREAYGHNVEEMNFKSDAKFARMKGRYGAASTLLTTGSNVSRDMLMMA